MEIRDDGARLDAVLRHLGCGRDIQDFPATANERVALIRTAAARGLIAWRRTHARYELTSFGWGELVPRRRFGVPSLIVSAVTGGIVAAIAIAVLWLPADASRPRGHSSAAISRPGKLQMAHSAETYASNYAPSPAISLFEDTAAVAPEPAINELPRLDRPDLADRAALDPPKAEPGAGVSKERGAKKSRKTAHHRRRGEGRSWAHADPWRGRGMRYAGYDGQRGWFGYR